MKTGFLVNRYGNVIGQTFVMLEETGYLSQGSEEVCGVFTLRESQSSVIYQFCMFFRLYCTLFMLFSAESIRSEYVDHRFQMSCRDSQV